jgi:hypothetical protein
MGSGLTKRKPKQQKQSAVQNKPNTVRPVSQISIEQQNPRTPSPVQNETNIVRSASQTSSSSRSSTETIQKVTETNPRQPSPQLSNRSVVTQSVHTSSPAVPNKPPSVYSKASSRSSTVLSKKTNRSITRVYIHFKIHL